MKSSRSQDWSYNSVRYACLGGASVLALVAAAAPALAGAEAFTAHAAVTASDTAAPQDAAPSQPSTTEDAAAKKKEKGATTVKEVVVTGIRGSLQTAAQVKRKASTFVDSISASDVSALPDVSVSEALGRIAGVTVTRYQYGSSSPDFPSAEGSGNLIRGLGFIRSEFNGRDEFTANGGRALDWSSVPPELVGGVDVYKNSAAELIEGGIGGTINLRTLEPFDRKGFFAAVSGDETYATLRGKSSPSYSAVISNRWNTPVGEFGLMGSFSSSQLDSQIYDWQQGAPIPRTEVSQPEPQGPAKFNGVDPSNIVGIIPVFQLRDPRMDRTRTSDYIAAQWKDADTVATFKYVRVKNHTTTIEHTVEHLPGLGDGPDVTIANMTTRPFNSTVALCNAGDGPTSTPPFACNSQIPVGGGLMTSGLISSESDSWFGPDGYNVHTLSRGVVDDALTEDYSFNVKRRFGEHWKLNFDAQYTDATAANTELWGVFETHLNVFERPGLNNPQVQFFTLGPSQQCPHYNTTNGVITGTTYKPCTSAINPGSLKPGETSTDMTSTADPNGYNWLAAFDHEHQGSGELKSTRLDLAYDFTDNAWFKTLKFGARYSERSQTDDSNQGNWAGVSPAWNGGAHGETIIGEMPTPGVFTYDNYKNFYNGHTVLGSNTTFVDLSPKYLLSYKNFANLFNTDPMLQGSLWQPRATMYGPNDISNVKEKVTDAYVQFDFAHDLGGGMSLDGNFGVRYANYDLDSAGSFQYHPFTAPSPCTIDPKTDPAGIQCTPRAQTTSFPQDWLPQTTAYVSQNATSLVSHKSEHHLLPSFNAKWNLNSEMLIRFAISEAMTRPNISDLRAAQVLSANTTLDQCVVGEPCYLTAVDPKTGNTVQVNNGPNKITLSSLGVTGGNPSLKSTTARNIDLSYEWYFKGGYISVAGFDKDLQNIIVYGTQTIGHTTLDGSNVPIVYTGQINQNRATVRGAEFQYQQFYDFLPGPLSHLGFQGNFSYINASVANADAGCTTPGGGPCRYGVKDLYGQSKYIYNLVGIYQDNKFEARIAYDWRSKYLVSLSDYMTGNPIYNEAAGFMDASIRYNFDRHLQLRFQAENILNTANKAEMLINDHNQHLDRYSVLNDQRFLFGLRYQF